VHIHARDPLSGNPTMDVSVFRQIAAGIKARNNVIICPTMAGGQGTPVEERIKVITALKLELASFNTGWINFAFYPIASAIQNVIAFGTEMFGDFCKNVEHANISSKGLLFDDETLMEARKTRHPVRPAEASVSAKKKKAVKCTIEGLPVQSFPTLMAALGTRCHNRCRIGEGISFTRLTEPTPLQIKALELLGL
jgi:hypothetical protein